MKSLETPPPLVVAPPFAVATGLGLVRRWRWAWLAGLLLLAGVIAFNLRELATAHPTTTTTTTASGVKTTVMAAGPNFHSWPLIALSLLVIMKLCTRSIRAEMGLSVGPRILVAETPPSPRAASPRPLEGGRATPKQFATAWLVVVLLLGLAGLMGWRV